MPDVHALEVGRVSRIAALEQQNEVSTLRNERTSRRVRRRAGRRRARSRWYFFLIGFRATCFVATRALSRPMRWRALWLIALARSFDQATDPAMLPFFYLPFMHSEALIDQDRSVHLYEALGDAEQLRYATEHRDVVQRFGGFRIETVRSAVIRRPPSRRFWNPAQTNNHCR